jgi:hypothetical protein
MNKKLLFVLLLTACSSQEEKILKRQAEINKETIKLIWDYKKKHLGLATKTFEEKSIKRDELHSFTDKISLLKEENDSLNRVLETTRKTK